MIRRPRRVGMTLLRTRPTRAGSIRPTLRCPRSRQGVRMAPPDATTLGAWIVGVGAIALALLGIARLTRALWRIFRSVSHFLEDWHGTPERPGRPPVPGFPERTEALEKHTEGMCDR